MPRSWRGVSPKIAVLSGRFSDEELIHNFGFKGLREIEEFRNRVELEREIARPDATRVQQRNRIRKPRSLDGPSVEPHPPARKV